jgi:hypothetical protein
MRVFAFLLVAAAIAGCSGEPSPFSLQQQRAVTETPAGSNQFPATDPTLACQRRPVC